MKIDRRVTVGVVTLHIGHIIEDYPDFSHIGKFSNYRMPVNENQKLVHRATGYILDHKGMWRNVRGHMVTRPSEREYSREYQYTFHDNGHDKLMYAYQDSIRIESMERGDWYYIAVVVKVIVDGVDIAINHLFGIESDSGSDYIKYQQREVAREVIGQAKEWFKNNHGRFARVR